MRVMVLVKENDAATAGELPPDDLFVEMNKFNEALVDAGVMLAGEGLAPSSVGKRVAFDLDGATTVIDGPFAEAKELVGGFWIWQVASIEEAIEWLKRSPFKGTAIEVRQIMGIEDYADQLPAEVVEAESRLREKLASQ
ncbi:YciI family protein [Jatrophihabitans sp.]|uniref:YciI family protein n=1 Tax=Jatrophihabitans sp. TaxID=1932789 RepID=UPI0030C6FD98|nr:YCII-like protein [Jatrophihabitans sp.]